MNQNNAAAATAVSTLLATSARHRILAWPRYERAIDLETLARLFGPAFGDRADLCLCLRHDPTIDIPLPDAIAAVSAALAKDLPSDPRFEVLMVDNPLNDDGWSSLARAITGVIMLPWSWDAQRHPSLSGLGHPLMISGEELRRHLEQAAAAAAISGPVVSVLVQSSHRPENLRRALDSLAAQTFRDFEVVIVNDGAGLESLLAPYTSKMAITYLRRGSDNNHPAARDAAVVIARGQYLTHLDDTDTYRPDHLATLVRSQNGTGPNT